MKTDIHPEYVLATVTCSCGNTFGTRSTKPELHVEICSNCHPFYTGKQKLLDTGGRVERFQRRLERAGGQARRGERSRLMANVGGQAVLEGVMMRGPGNWAVAVRTPSGEIAQVSRPIDSAMARHVFFRLPIVRGVMALGESLAIGFRALAISANYAQRQEGEDGEVDTELSRGALIFAFAIAIGFAIAVFKVGPALITDQLPVHSGGWFVIVEGLIRVSMFVGYLALISLLPDLRRVFQYHAAEHKAINAYEAGEPLEPVVVQRYSLIHPRCGTAFLLWVMVIAVFVFAFFGRP